MDTISQNPSLMVGMEVRNALFRSASVSWDEQDRNGISRANGLDSGCNQATCSVKSINDIISGFDENKRRLVEAIGFGGLLKFPPIKSTNRRFSSWLMGLVDVGKSCLALTNGSVISFNKNDLAIVFGIPDSGKRVTEAKQLNREAKERMKLQCWPSCGKDERSNRAVQRLLDTRYAGGMSTDQENAFKVAFVIFVMSTLFVPGAKHDYVQEDYWGALADTSSIHMYDWAEYIHKKLLSSAAKYMLDVESGSRSPNITGCYLFLQVLYLDNLDIGAWGMDHTVLPRISTFTYSRLKGMIAADTVQRQYAKSTPKFGKSKVMRSERSCYTWARAAIKDQPANEESMHIDKETQISLWKAAVKMARVLHLPLEAAGPLFVAAADFDRRRLIKGNSNGIECINVLLSIMEPFVNGFRYQFEWQASNNGVGSLDSQMEVTADLDQQCPGSKCCKHDMASQGKKLAFELCLGSGSSSSANFQDHPTGRPKSSAAAAHRWVEDLDATNGSSPEGVDYLVIKSMAQFYLLVRRIKEYNRIDLNTGASDEDEWLPVQHKFGVSSHEDLRSPWELGGFWPVIEQTPNVFSATPGQQYSTGHIQFPHIVHYWPKYIEVMPNAAREQQMGVSEMEMDTMDAIMRSFMQSDDILYKAEGRLRWRHFFESDFLTAIMAGCFDIENPCIRNQFVGPHLKYDIYRCRMLFFPVILHQSWVCFCWDMKKNAIRVFDPLCISITASHMGRMYTHISEMLKRSLSASIRVLFEGWDHNWLDASVEPFKWRFEGTTCLNRSGVLCAYFCRCFNGDILLPDIDQVDIGRISSLMFAEMCGLTGQIERLPSTR